MFDWIADPTAWLGLLTLIALEIVLGIDNLIFIAILLITAVGMVNELSIMMIAVVVAIAVMMVASGPLAAFVSAHPTVVVLCLGFLLMIGFSLVVEAFHIHVPKGYLYAAIAFSVLVEAFNQVAFRRTRQRALAQGRKLRGRVADAIVSMLGTTGAEQAHAVDEVAALADASARANLFADTERDMVRAVLHLAERPVQSVMRPREQVVWLDLDESPQRLRERILATGYERYPLARGSLDRLVGVGRAVPLLSALERKQRIEPGDYAAPLRLAPGISVLQALERFRPLHEHLGIVMDERNSVRGVVSVTDVLEAIAGDLPEAHEKVPRAQDAAAQAAGAPGVSP